MKNQTVLLILILLPLSVFGQQVKKALFIGNSYTGVNNLPLITADVALSTGDTLIVDASTPGGFTLQGHSTNISTLNYIYLGDYDFVVLQEQSQRPSFPLWQVEQDVFPYAEFLDSLINAHNPCAETVFYRTWGRKNGDASNCANWPPVCTYAGMDSLLALRYQMMADSNDAFVSPVGEVWKYIREQHPSLELYAPDESHPSQLGSYVGALTFYVTFFRKDPALVTYNYTINPTEANLVKAAVKAVVYDSLSKWNIGEWDPVADFSAVNLGSNMFEFINLSVNADSYLWDFGDGTYSTLESPYHTYQSSGVFTVTLTASHCQLRDTMHTDISTIPIILNARERSPIHFWPNPTANQVYFKNPEKEAFELYLYNTQGKLLQKSSHSRASGSIQTAELPQGLYYIVIKTDEGYYSEKLIRQ